MKEEGVPVIEGVPVDVTLTEGIPVKDVLVSITLEGKEVVRKMLYCILI